MAPGFGGGAWLLALTPPRAEVWPRVAKAGATFSSLVRPEESQSSGDNPAATSVTDWGSANGDRVRMPGGDHDREPEAPTQLCAVSRSTAPRSSATNPRRAPSRRSLHLARVAAVPWQLDGDELRISQACGPLDAMFHGGFSEDGDSFSGAWAQSGRRSGGQPPLHDRRQPDRVGQRGRRAAGEKLVPGAARGGARLAPMPNIANAAARPFQAHRPCPCSARSPSSWPRGGSSRCSVRVGAARHVSRRPR